MIYLLSFTISILVLTVSSKQMAMFVPSNQADFYALDGYYWVCKVMQNIRFCQMVLISFQDTMCHPAVVETEKSPLVTAGGAMYKRTDFPNQSPYPTRFFVADMETVPKSYSEDDFQVTFIVVLDIFIQSNISAQVGQRQFFRIHAYISIITQILNTLHVTDLICIYLLNYICFRFNNKEKYLNMRNLQKIII